MSLVFEDATYLNPINVIEAETQFVSSATFDNDVSARDVFLYSGASNRTIQWINSNNSNNIGMVEGDITNECLKLTSKNDLEFRNQSNQIIAKVNKNGTPTDGKDLVLLENLKKPSYFCIGKSAETVSVLNLDSGIVFINSASNRKIQTMVLSVNYMVHMSSSNSLTTGSPSGTDLSVIRYHAQIGIIFNKENPNSIIMRNYIINGNVQMTGANSGTGGIGYTPIVIGRVGERLTIQYNWKSSSSANITTSTWISGVFCSMEIACGSTGSPFLSPNTTNNNGSSAGDLFFSLT